MKLHKVCAAVSGGLLVVSLAACGNSDSDSGTASGGTIKLAAIAPLTGDSASYGENLRDGIDLAVKSINASGGVDGKTVKVEFFDDQCDPSVGANAATKIAADDSFLGVMGPVCSSAAMAEVPILGRAGLSVLSGDNTSPLLTGRFPNYARTIPSDAQEAVNMLRLATQTLHKNKLGVLYASDDFGQPIYQALQKSASQYGAQIVSAETFTPSQTKDFTPALTKIASHDPDILVFVGYYNDIGLAVSQLGNAGLSGIDNLSTAGVDNPAFIKLAGKEAEGSDVYSYYNNTNPSSENQNFVKAFQAAYHREPNEQAAYGYELPFIYAKAFESGATKSDLIDKVKQVTFDGPSGTTKFLSNGDVDGKAGVVLSVRDGKFVLDEALTKAASGGS